MLIFRLLYGVKEPSTPQLQIGDSRLKKEIVITTPDLLKSGGLDVDADDQLHLQRLLQDSGNNTFASLLHRHATSITTSSTLQHLVDDIILDDSRKAQDRTGAHRLGCASDSCRWRNRIRLWMRPIGDFWCQHQHPLRRVSQKQECCCNLNTFDIPQQTNRPQQHCVFLTHAVVPLF